VVRKNYRVTELGTGDETTENVMSVDKVIPVGQYPRPEPEGTPNVIEFALPPINYKYVYLNAFFPHRFHLVEYKSAESRPFRRRIHIGQFQNFH
jgi:hypothetical protein